MKIEIQNLTKNYGGFRAVDHLSFSFRSGTLTAIVGRNGSGKTTTIRSLLGLIPMDEGKILVNGVPGTLNLKRVGYLAEERGMFPKETVESQLIFLAQLKGMSSRDAARSLDRWLERFGISQYKKSPLESLSKGNQQKIQMLASLLHDPDIIIFDEPFSGLDPVNMQLVIELLRELCAEGRCILVSSHQLPLIEQVCEDICIIDRSRCAYWGSLKELKVEKGGSLVRFTVSDPVPAALNAQETAPGRYQVQLGTAETPDFSAFLQKLLDTGLSPDTLERSGKSLQEIFLELVGEEEAIQ